MTTDTGHGADPAAPDDEGTPAAEPAAAAVTAEAFAALQAEHARATAALAKVKDEAARNRIAKREATEAAAAAAKTSGDQAALNEALEAQLAELRAEYDAAAPLIDYGRQYQTEAEARIAASAAKLSPEAQAALDASPTVPGKLAILRAFEAMQPAAPAESPADPVTPIPAQAPGGAPGAAPAAKPAVDLMVEMKAGRMTPSQAAIYDPAQYARIANNLGRNDRPRSPTLGLMGL